MCNNNRKKRRKKKEKYHMTRSYPSKYRETDEKDIKEKRPEGYFKSTLVAVFVSITLSTASTARGAKMSEYWETILELSDVFAF
jgi:hypothetical protein